MLHGKTVADAREAVVTRSASRLGLIMAAILIAAMSFWSCGEEPGGEEPRAGEPRREGPRVEQPRVEQPRVRYFVGCTARAHPVTLRAEFSLEEGRQRGAYWEARYDEAGRLEKTVSLVRDAREGAFQAGISYEYSYGENGSMTEVILKRYKSDGSVLSQRITDPSGGKLLGTAISKDQFDSIPPEAELDKVLSDLGTPGESLYLDTHVALYYPRQEGSGGLGLLFENGKLNRKFSLEGDAALLSDEPGVKTLREAYSRAQLG